MSNKYYLTYEGIECPCSSKEEFGDFLLTVGDKFTVSVLNERWVAEKDGSCHTLFAKAKFNMSLLGIYFTINHVYIFDENN